MTEDEFQELVIARCNELELLWFHSFDSRRDRMAGFPDLVIVGHGTLFRELKAKSTVSAHQSHWGRALRAAGCNWAVWYPADWESGRVQRELRELAFCPLVGARQSYHVNS